MTAPIVLDLFAGPGGWDHGIRTAGYTGPLVGVEWDTDACNTARAAGHTRVQTDVATLEPGAFGPVWGLIASPPCQGFSMAGKGKGRADAEALLGALADVATAPDPLDELRRALEVLRDTMLDPRSLFALEPLRYLLTTRPAWTAWEQVPAVQPIWDACAEVLRAIGYTVDTGILSAEQYGVPQTRRRAVLVAHAPWMPTPAKLPEPTHSRFYNRNPRQLDDDVQPWVSMADALGWGMIQRPYPTIAAGTAAGGAYGQMIGGSHARKVIATEHEAGRWIPKPWDDSPEHWNRPFQFAGAGATARHTAQQRPRDLDEPAHTITGKGTAAWTPTDSTGPAGRRVTIAEAAVLQTFPADYPWQGTKTAQYRQVGDAVPPRLAHAVLTPILAATTAPQEVAA